ncbi:MAG: hypothetical protein HXY34_03150 [Candidatus Thorarchaeota archaeon]|nr:hypothetical protein [Candidatus Thorarchaeota archaeon]
MSDRLRSNLYASIATLDQLKKMYEMGVVDVSSFRRESEALLQDIAESIDALRRDGLDVSSFFWGERIPECFPEATRLIEVSSGRSDTASQSVDMERYYDQIGLAALDVATANSSKGIMGLAELIVEVVKRLPQYKNVRYADVIEAVNRVAEHGLIPGIRTLRGGVKVVQLRPLELGPDQAEVINLAATRGSVTIEEVMMQLKWSEDHARQVLTSLVDAGMAVANVRLSTGGRYHFPGLKARDDTTT